MYCWTIATFIVVTNYTDTFCKHELHITCTYSYNSAAFLDCLLDKITLRAINEQHRYKACATFVHNQHTPERLSESTPGLTQFINSKEQILLHTSVACHIPHDGIRHNANKHGVGQRQQDTKLYIGSNASVTIPRVSGSE